MRPLWFVLLAAPLAAGCRGILGIDDPYLIDGGSTSCAGWSPKGFDPCALGTPLGAIDLSAGVFNFDTETGVLYNAIHAQVASSSITLTQSDGSTVRVLAAEAFTLEASATLSVTGHLPLLLVSWSSLQITGTLDASSHRGDLVGAGGDATAESCAGGGQPGAKATTSGSGGGGGGGFQGVGGSGSSGGGASAAGGGGGVRAMPAVIRGGCPGGASGDQSASTTTHALAGRAGGAVRLVAKTEIVVDGAVLANGEGGAGAPTNSACGGGGGGSGGYIGLDAPTVTIHGRLAANGGGGGGGGPTSGSGNSGSDGAAGDLAAAGGAVATGGCGQAGGQGSFQGAFDGTSATGTDACGGGGGGGAAGFILVASPGYTATAQAKISPPASQN